MVWDIGSILISKSYLSYLRNRLLWSYLAVITVILGSFSTAIYSLVARDRHHQLNLHLYRLGLASAQSLEIIQHEYQELITKENYAGYIHRQKNAIPQPITLYQLMGKYRADSIEDVVANFSTPKLENQSIEWFDADLNLMAREGHLFAKTPLTIPVDTAGEWRREDKIRSFVLPVYRTTAGDRSVLLGYVRASESTIPLESELRELQKTLALGVAIVSGLIALGGAWLTQQSLRPVLASLNQLKQFTADASHELRNPLTAIRASIAVMQSHPDRIHPADVGKLQAIASASTQMSQLVEDLLLLSRLDRQLDDRNTWQIIALEEILEDLVMLYGDRAAEKGIALNFDGNTSVAVNSDGAQLHRLFANLIANGLQYTPAGGSVTVSLRRSDSRAEVAVQDTGIGIPPEQLPYLFNRFWRADQARTYHGNGSGLGLAIAHAVAQHHNGNTTVDSRPGQGSTFTVSLPLAARS